jgi:Plasmid pRiA4b ORF-3-like protein
MGDIARLSVEIDDVSPRVVRVVDVSVDIRLDDLHFVLQIAIGWQNGHPFEFRIGEKVWGQPDRDAPLSPMPAEQSTLSDVLTSGKTFKYDYVLGEDWEHTVTLLARASARPEMHYPHLVSAEGRCPPADIGGPVGYETYLQSIADPNSVNHDEMLEFDAPDFDPHVVDEAMLRKNLKELTRYIGRKPVTRHPEVAAQRPSKGDGPAASAVSFEARSARTSG